jgi:UDPglucose 6-dehydrogenase
MKSIAVIGQGFVGGSLTTVFAERGFDVYVYDKAGKQAKGGKSPFAMYGTEHPCANINEFVHCCESTSTIDFSGVYFVCLPTPMREDGSADLSIVEGVLEQLSKIEGSRIAVVKSTVPPGSVANWNEKFSNSGLHIVFNPEFLREASALDDMRNQDRIILGGPRPWINTVKTVFEAAFPSVPIIKTSSSTAEMVKYVTNVHLAVKVSLANEFYQICKALDANGVDIDYDKVIEYATLDKRLGSSHWKVPGPMPDDITGLPALGFAGSCFIKDLNALMIVAKDLGIDPKTMNGAWQKNLEVRPQRDWEKLVGRAISEKKK